jgi:hypothetical protein
MLAKGIGFYVDNSGFSQIQNITSFGLSGTTWKTEDTTSHDSATPVETLQPTIRNDGKISLIISPYIPGNTEHAFLRTLSLSSTANNFRIIYPASELGSFDISGYVTSFSFDTPVNGLLKAKVDITVNGTLTDDAATLRSVTVTDAHAGTYVTSDVCELTATFDEVVKVTGTPRISVVLGSGTVFATYASGSNSNVLKFTKTFGGGDTATATHFSVSSPIGLNSGTINDIGGNAATLTFTPPTTTSFTVN